MIGTLATRWGLFFGFERRHLPPFLRALRFDARHQHDKHFALWAGRWKRNFDPRFQLLDTYRNFQECSSDGLEGGGSELRALRRCPAHHHQQPIGARVHKQPELIGLPAVTGSSV